MNPSLLSYLSGEYDNLITQCDYCQRFKKINPLCPFRSNHTIAYTMAAISKSKCYL